MNTLIGKRVILFPLEEHDLDDFVKIHRNDKRGVMCRFSLKEMTEEEARKYTIGLLAARQIIVWVVMTKEGKASRKAGYIYISDLSKFSVNVSGIMSRDFATGLSKQIRRNKYTFAQDALHTLLKHCFDELGLERIECGILEENRTAVALALREGFTKEGTLRKYFCINDELKNIVILSILKPEFHDVAVKEGQSSNGPAIQLAKPFGIPVAVG